MNAIKTSKMSNFRWVICALLFLATTVNYMDRQVLSLTWKDFIAPEFHWTDDDYGTITGLFSIFYAIANLFAFNIRKHALHLFSDTVLVYHLSN